MQRSTGEKKNLIYSLPQRSGWRTRSEHLSDKSALGCWQSTYRLHLLSAALPVKRLNRGRAEVDRTHRRSVKVQVLFELWSLWNIKNVRMQHGWMYTRHETFSNNNRQQCSCLFSLCPCENTTKMLSFFRDSSEMPHIPTEYLRSINTFNPSPW